MKFRMKTLVVSAVVVCSSLVGGSAQAAGTWQFGTDGSDGWNGSTGPAGRDGRDVSIAADGSQQFYDLRGTDGRDGGDGSMGSDANGCYSQGTPSHNLRGADGGDGGDAGDGGRGGHGGSVTVFYSDVQSLKGVRVLSTPGRGALPGRAGYGGDGCNCYNHSWSKESCSTDSDGHSSCSTYTYYCQDGTDGSIGYRGSRGSDGSYGGIYLVKDLEEIPSQELSVNVRLSDIGSGPFELRRNRWSQHSGAEALFAPGSDIRSDYSVFRENVARRYAIRWEAPRPIAEFASRVVNLSIDSSFRIRPSWSSELWVSAVEIVEGDLTTLVIKNVVTAGEAVSLSVGELTGSGASLELRIDDVGGVSDLVQTRFEVKLETKVIFWYIDRFEGALDSEFVRREGNQFFLRLGQLLKKEKWGKPGKDIRVSITATRSFAGQSKTWSVQKKKMEVPKIKK